MEHLVDSMEKVVQSVDRASSAPQVVIRPIADKVKEIRDELRNMATEMEKNKNPGAELDEKAKEGLDNLEREVASLIEEMQEGINSSPWFKPNDLKEMRKTENKLADKVAALHQRQQKSFPGMRVPKVAPSWDETAMVNEALLAQFINESALPNMHCPVWHITHAAGVGTQDPFQNSSPKSYEYVLAPKAQAAWVLHQMNVIRP